MTVHPAAAFLFHSMHTMSARTPRTRRSAAQPPPHPAHTLIPRGRGRLGAARRPVAGGFATLTFDGYQGAGDDEDIACTEAFLPGLQDFYRRAARSGLAVIFTVDQ
ncbi:hypothetical protein KNE206_76880 [Kitasatospora sp. NE20-6]|uniref:hypothetical protein n=1 Tax=Kitasatospora sp. NE20-6 TaxID=2859066 RepID=UPI0034DCC424